MKMILAALVLAASPVYADDAPAPSTCETVSKMAEKVMSGRQHGIPMREMMRIAEESDPVIRRIMVALTIEAFDKPQYSTPRYRLEEEIQFGSAAYLSCAKAIAD